MLRHNAAGREAVLDHLRSCDAAFQPPLSSRVALPEYADRLMRHADRFEAWEVDTGALVGLVAVYCNAADRGDAFITSVSVVAAQHGAGLGRMLVAAAVVHAAEAGFARICLKVADAATAARHVYRALGFVEIGRDGDEVSLARSLRSGSHPLDSTAQGE